MICVSQGGEAKKKRLGSSLEEMPGRTSRHWRGARQANIHPGWSQGWWLVPTGCRWWVAGEPPGWHRVPRGGAELLGELGTSWGLHTAGGRGYWANCGLSLGSWQCQSKRSAPFGVMGGCPKGAGGEGCPDSSRTLSPWGNRHGKVHARSSQSGFQTSSTPGGLQQRLLQGAETARTCESGVKSVSCPGARREGSWRRRTDSLLSPCDDTVRHGKAIPRPPGQGPSWAPRSCASSWPRSLAPLPVTFSLTSCASLEPLLAASPPHGRS